MRLPPLSPSQIERLLALLEGKEALVSVDGEAFSVRLAGTSGWRVYNLREGSEYLVRGTECTCPDSVYRGRRCKHWRALEWFRGTSDA